MSGTDSHTADALREILATCADPLNRACEEYAKLERELAEVRAALAGEDFASLPSDFPTVRMAHTIRSERDKFLWQVRDTCARAEKAESAASETRRTDNDVLEAAAVLAERWHYPMLAHDLRALKKADPQVPETTGTQDRDSTAPPVGSAPCSETRPTRFRLSGGYELWKNPAYPSDNKPWELLSETGAHIRYLDENEAQFVEGALSARAAVDTSAPCVVDPIPDDTMDRLLVGKATQGDQMIAYNALRSYERRER